MSWKDFKVFNLRVWDELAWVNIVWPWNENGWRKKKQQTNENRGISLVYRTDTNPRGYWLVKRTLGWKNFMPEKFLEINRYFALTSLQHDWPLIEQCLLYIRVFSGRKTKSPCFDLFIHWLIKQVKNTYRIIFKTYEKCSLSLCCVISISLPLK